MRAPRRMLGWFLLLPCLVLAAACARIPEDGPVVDGAAPEVEASAAPFEFSPAGPQPGATPEQVVAGFLVAHQATPVSTTVARQFLTERAADSWQPRRSTLLYAELDVLTPPVQTQRAPMTVPVSLQRVFALDGTGRWDGRRQGLQREGLPITVVREDGEWRVSDPPDALVLPLSHFENRYRRFALHFADPSGSLLVPEPVYLPLDVQTPTQLVESLLAGPRGPERAVDRTFLPPGTDLVVSVPVDTAGLARVPLSEEVLELPRRDLRLAAAQLVATVGQVPDVTAVQVTVEGEPVSVPGVGEVVATGALEQYSPLVATASTDLYGVRRGEVRRVTEQGETSLLGLPPALRPVTSLGVSLLGNPVAVTDGGGGLHVLARASRGVEARRVRSLSVGSVVDPTWDWTRALWLVPDRLGDTVPVLVGGKVRRLTWSGPDMAGRRVRAVTVSRDGSRLVLAVAGAGGGSELLVSRVQRASDGSAAPIGLRPAQRLGRLPAVIDLGWRDSQSLAVLVAGERQRSRVLVVPVDGQRESRTLNADSDVLFGRPVAMAADPVTGEVRVTTRRAAVHLLTGEGRWLDVAQDAPLRLPTFVG